MQTKHAPSQAKACTCTRAGRRALRRHRLPGAAVGVEHVQVVVAVRHGAAAEDQQKAIQVRCCDVRAARAGGDVRQAAAALQIGPRHVLPPVGSGGQPWYTTYVRRNIARRCSLNITIKKDRVSAKNNYFFFETVALLA